MKRQMFRAVALIWMVLAIALPVGAQDATPSASPVASAEGAGLEAATTWLMEQQLEDGAFAGFTGEADAGTSVDAIIALASASQAGIDVGTSIDDALAYLANDDVVLVYEEIGVGQAAKLVLALVAAGENPEDFAGNNPLSIVQNGQDAETGMYGSQLYDHAYAMMAISATGGEIDDSALDALVSTQADNGGWGYEGTSDAAMADSNTTAMIVQALVATGNEDHESVAMAVEYLESVTTDAGAAYAVGAGVDGNSTALVLQAMIATGGETAGLETALMTFQTESGAFFYMEEDPAENLFTTVQAIPAAAGYALPLVDAESAMVMWSLAA